MYLKKSKKAQNLLSKECFTVLNRDLKSFTEEAVLIYSGKDFQIEVPEKMKELQNNSVLGLSV